MKRYNFDRVGYAMGVAVHADNMEDAIKAANELNAKTLIEMGRRTERERLVFRDNEKCASKCSICGVGMICGTCLK